MKLCDSCLEEDELICDWCKRAPKEYEEEGGKFYCEETGKKVSWIDPACDKFECFMIEKKPKQEGLF